MFGMKKNIDNLQRQLQRMEHSLSSFAQKRTEEASVLADKMDTLAAGANRHDMAIEDLLDSWEEMQREQQERSANLEADLNGALRKELRERERNENALLELVLAYHDQIYGLARTAEGAWARQLALMEEKLAGTRLSMGLQIVAERDVPVNYALHEVVEALAAPEAPLAGRVAEVYACGYVYQGRVLRKARVSAYRNFEGPASA